MKRAFIVLIIIAIAILSFVFLQNPQESIIKEPPQTMVTPRKEVAIVFGNKVFSEDLNNTVNADEVTMLSLIIENTMRNKLSDIFDTPAGDEAVEKWLKKIAPEVLENHIFGRKLADAEKIYEALLSVHSSQLTLDEAYDKHLKGTVDEPVWKTLSTQFSDTRGLEAFKGELDKSYQDVLKGIIKRYKVDYLMDQIRGKVCELPHVDKKIKAALAKKVMDYSKYSFSSQEVDSMVKDKLKSYCFIYTLEELVKLQKESVTILEPEYSNALSLTGTYKQWQFHKKVLP